MSGAIISLERRTHLAEHFARRALDADKVEHTLGRLGIEAILDQLFAHLVAGLVGRGDGELAAVGAGAGDDVGEEAGLGGAEADLGELAVEHGQVRFVHPAEDDVLLRVGARVAVGILA